MMRQPTETWATKPAVTALSTDAHAALALHARCSARQNARSADYIRYKLSHDMVFDEVAPATFFVRASCAGELHDAGLHCGYCSRARGALLKARGREERPQLRCPRCGSDDTHYLALRPPDARGVRLPRQQCQVRRARRSARDGGSRCWRRRCARHRAGARLSFHA
jgi:hypothetical protein